ncbi:MAG: metal-dependent transcriptional regulator [Promethearchaeota archaeon]
MYKDYKESHENYLKAIYLISKKKKGGWVLNSEIAEFLKVKPSSVTEMLYKLKNEGFIIWRPRKSIHLTVKGKKVAQSILRKNKELKKFFKNILNLKDDLKLNEICCKIEHHITPEVRIALEHLNSTLV